MKTSNSVAKTAALTAAISLLSVTAHAIDTPLPTPTGSISADSLMIQEGQYPTITWNINYPPKPPLGPDGKTERDLVADVRTIGQGVNGWNGPDMFYIRTRGLLSVADLDFKIVFDGVNSNVNSTVSDLGSLFDPKYNRNFVPQGTKLRFAGEYLIPGTVDKWATRYFSGDGTSNIRMLRQGDTPPVGLANENGGLTLESYLKPYLNSAGKVNIGPMDMIVFMELTHSVAEKTSPGYDFQDLLLLVSFSEPVKP